MKHVIIRHYHQYRLWLYLLPVLLVSFYPFAKLVRFPYNMPLLALLCMAAFAAINKSLPGMGFKKIESRRHTVLFTIISFIIIEISFDLVIQPVIEFVFNEPADYSAYNFLKGNTGKYRLYMLYAWISAAIAEEIVYRGFLIYAAERIFRRTWIAVTLSSGIFGIAHLYQGWSGVLVTFLFGIVFSIVYLRSGRNIVVAIIVHGLIDSLFLSLAYTGHLNYYENPIRYMLKIFR